MTTHVGYPDEVSKKNQAARARRTPREIREALDIPQQEFATLLGVAVSTLSRWENRDTAEVPLRNDVLQRLFTSLFDEALNRTAQSEYPAFLKHLRGISARATSVDDRALELVTGVVLWKRGK